MCEFFLQVFLSSTPPREGEATGPFRHERKRILPASRASLPLATRGCQIHIEDRQDRPCGVGFSVKKRGVVFGVVQRSHPRTSGPRRKNKE